MVRPGRKLGAVLTTIRDTNDHLLIESPEPPGEETSPYPFFWVPVAGRCATSSPATLSSHRPAPASARNPWLELPLGSAERLAATAVAVLRDSFEMAHPGPLSYQARGPVFWVADGLGFPHTEDVDGHDDDDE